MSDCQSLLHIEWSKKIKIEKNIRNIGPAAKALKDICVIHTVSAIDTFGISSTSKMCQSLASHCIFILYKWVFKEKSNCKLQSVTLNRDAPEQNL